MMRKFGIAFFILLLSWPGPHARASAGEPDRIRAGRPFDLQGFIDRELSTGKRQIIVPPGRYRVQPRNRTHLALTDLDGVEIIAEGVEMICTETTRAITIENCRKLTIRGLTVDYDPLPFTQGKIVEISPDGLVHEIELLDGYPASGEMTGKKYEIFCPDTRTLRFGSYHGCKIAKPAAGRIRIIKSAHYRNKQPEQVGDLIAIDCANAPGGSLSHAILINQSRQVTLEDIRLHGSNCFGFFETDCCENVYRRCIVDRRPAETDIKPRAVPRLRSLNADAFHSKHAEIGPAYLSCRARFQGDDCVAVNGDYHMVMAARGKDLRVLAKHELNIQTGDPVELVSYDGMRLADATVVSIEREGDIKDEEAGFLRKQRMTDELKNNRRGCLTKAYRIVIDHPVSLPMGSLICSANRIGNGFRVIGCEFGFNRSRGILVKAGRGEIRDNRLEGCWSEAIKLAPEYWWLEAGSGTDVVIHDNVIRNCLSRSIAVTSNGGEGKISPAGAHRNITITGNRIENSPAPQILVTSTDGLVITNNVIHQPGDRPLLPEQAIETEHCSHAQVSGNEVGNDKP